MVRAHRWLFPLCVPLAAADCPPESSGDDSGDPDEITCWEGGSAVDKPFPADVQEVPSTCMEPMWETWATGDYAQDLWNWEYHLVNEPTSGFESEQQPAADQAASLFSDLEGFVPAGSENARHATAYLAAAVAADTLYSSDMERGCSLVNEYASCGLEKFLTGESCPTLPGPPPPPAGDDPEDFCAELAALVPSSGANGLACTVSPLSTTLSFIASQEGGQTSAQWLTVASNDPTRPQRVWWPAWMAAYAADAPALLMYSTTDTGGNAASGVLVVHEIGLKVSGPRLQVQRFDAYIEERLRSTTTNNPAPDWSKLTFALPSRMTYRTYPDLNQDMPQDVLRTWTPGQRLVLPDGREADFAFTALVGLIDPCRGEGGGSTGACTNNGLSWVEVLAELETAGKSEIFFQDPEQLCAP